MTCLKTIAMGLHIASWHSSGGYNDVTPGGYLRTCNVQMGVYYNSFNKLTVYGAGVFEYKKAFVFLGAATGYPKKIMPIGGVGIKLDKYRVFYAPQVAGHNRTHLLHVAMDF